MVSVQEKLAVARVENQRAEQEVVAQQVRLAAHTETAQSAHDGAAEAADLAKKAKAEALELAKALKQAEKKVRDTAEAERQAQSTKTRAANVEQQSAQQLVRLQQRADAGKLELKALLGELEKEQKEYEAKIAALQEIKSAVTRELAGKRSLESSLKTVEPGPPAQRRRTVQSAPGIAAELHRDTTSTSGAVVSADRTSAASAERLEPRLSVVQAAAVTPPAANSPAVNRPSDPRSATTLSGAKEAFRAYYNKHTDFGKHGHKITSIEHIENLEGDDRRVDGVVEAGDQLTLTYYSTVDENLYRIHGFWLHAIETDGDSGCWRVDPASIVALSKKTCKADGFWGSEDEFVGSDDDGDYRP
eukprot:COSAG02_NODE_1518_length_12179_cov_6.141060_6_plen_360_part_00